MDRKRSRREGLVHWHYSYVAQQARPGQAWQSAVAREEIGEVLVAAEHVNRIQCQF
jgi:hypothetical protein